MASDLGSNGRSVDFIDVQLSVLFWVWARDRAHHVALA
jgi:hypothetical protein